MGIKGVKTKELIRHQAYRLFAEKGFSAISMKDLCEACGLSRGGLYRHYGSTQQVFEDILEETLKADEEMVQESMKEGASAGEILEGLLERMRQEMLDEKHSLSYALYEYSVKCDNRFMIEQNCKAKQKWQKLIEYGIQRGEFAAVNVEQMTDIILYAYQGVRMWSRMVRLEEKTAQNIVDRIRTDLEGEGV
ncbi:TetR/AcrR family transcriptional regulator [Ruminococcus sp. OA3]|uniref:TetR/AcrR family transcriptional regulator n=1 Tax=Ruminococcus sp. OA3 TaxID=2914164 RepID=UPI001F061937|nr:TetR/AcrR family transcriptional regulator [Ruminococcus sp. OA3]MCH1981176.1 TetR/AcrR family transcriptional regulator [Ruminococcus sp. OA3]